MGKKKKHKRKDKKHYVNNNTLTSDQLNEYQIMIKHTHPDKRILFLWSKNNESIATKICFETSRHAHIYYTTRYVAANTVQGLNLIQDFKYGIIIRLGECEPPLLVSKWMELMGMINTSGMVYFVDDYIDEFNYSQ
ncbi:MAG: hypothetical protein QXT63_02200 [Thermoplasmata archaeon]